MEVADTFVTVDGASWSLIGKRVNPPAHWLWVGPYRTPVKSPPFQSVPSSATKSAQLPALLLCRNGGLNSGIKSPVFASQAPTHWILSI